MNKRQLEIEKSKEEFAFRLILAKAKEDAEQAALLRLNMLLLFLPGKSDRQLLNHAKINCK